MNKWYLGICPKRAYFQSTSMMIHKHLQHWSNKVLFAVGQSWKLQMVQVFLKSWFPHNNLVAFKNLLLQTSNWSHWSKNYVKGQAFSITVRKLFTQRPPPGQFIIITWKSNLSVSLRTKCLLFGNYRPTTTNGPNWHQPSYWPDAHATSDEVKNLTEAPPDALLVARFNLPREFPLAHFRLAV